MENEHRDLGQPVCPIHGVAEHWRLTSEDGWQCVMCSPPSSWQASEGYWTASLWRSSGEEEQTAPEDLILSGREGQE